MGPHEVERVSADERAEVQLDRLRGLIGRLRAADTPYWRQKLGAIEPPDIAALDDLARLPTTQKSELRDHYPLGMLAVALDDVVRVHASSGTSGKPTVVAYTANDLAVFAEVNARALTAAGATSTDVVHVAYGYGLFTGGLGLHDGAQQLGATTVPASGGNVPLQLTLLADLAATVLCATPSFALLLAERADEAGLRDLPLRRGVFGAEPWSEGMREKLCSAWSRVTGAPFDACDIYGASELIGPGVAMECVEAQDGLHCFDDHFLPEVLDPETGAPLADGERGELVVTTLTKEALPVLRYRTGDVTTLRRATCACGRTHPRIERFSGRVDDMLVIRGVNVFPSEIESVVLDEPELTGTYAIVVDRRAALPRLEVHVETSDDEPDGVTDRLTKRLAERLRVRAEVLAGPPGTLPRQEVGKAKRVFARSAEHDELADLR